MKIHEVKTHPEYFQLNRSGVKPFELRYNDRDYREGDYLYSREYHPVLQKYTGRWSVYRIDYTLKGEWLAEGYIAMTIASIQDYAEYVQVLDALFMPAEHA